MPAYQQIQDNQPNLLIRAADAWDAIARQIRDQSLPVATDFAGLFNDPRIMSRPDGSIYGSSAPSAADLWTGAAAGTFRAFFADAAASLVLRVSLPASSVGGPIGLMKALDSNAGENSSIMADVSTVLRDLADDLDDLIQAGTEVDHKGAALIWPILERLLLALGVGLFFAAGGAAGAAIFGPAIAGALEPSLQAILVTGAASGLLAFAIAAITWVTNVIRTHDGSSLQILKNLQVGLQKSERDLLSEALKEADSKQTDMPSAPVISGFEIKPEGVGKMKALAQSSGDLGALFTKLRNTSAIKDQCAIPRSAFSDINEADQLYNTYTGLLGATEDWVSRSADTWTSMGRSLTAGVAAYEAAEAANTAAARSVPVR
jgi:hypothetical protein